MAKTPNKAASRVIFGNKEKKQFPDPEGLEREKAGSSIDIDSGKPTDPIGFGPRMRGKFSEAAPPMPGAKQTLASRISRVRKGGGVSIAAPRKEESDMSDEGNKTYRDFVTEAKKAGRPKKLKPGEEADTLHLQDQLSKLTHPNHVEVHFRDNTKHDIPRQHANKALQHLASLKPIHRADHAEHMGKGYAEFYHVLTRKSIPDKKSKITLAGPKLRKEEVEQVDEVLDSAEKFAGYVTKAAKQIHSYDPYKDSDKDTERVARRVKGLQIIQKKIDKQQAKRSSKNEEVEQIDELKRKTLASYVKKAGGTSMDSVGGLMYQAGNADPKTNRRVDLFKTAAKRAKGIERAASRLAKEEAEQIDELSIYKMQAIEKEASKRNRDMSDPKGTKHQVYGTEVAGERIKNKAGTYWPSTTHKIIDKIGDKLKGRAMADYNKNYSSKKDKKNFGEEYDDDGWHAHREMYGDKGVSREDWKKGIRKKPAMKKEEVEQIDEIGNTPRGQKTLKSYMKKSGREIGNYEDEMGNDGPYGDFNHGSGDEDADRKYNNRTAGYDRAHNILKKKLKKEEVENDDGWYAHREMHGDKGVSREDWKKGIRMNAKGQKVSTKKEETDAEVDRQKRLAKWTKFNQKTNYSDKPKKDGKNAELVAGFADDIKKARASRVKEEVELDETMSQTKKDNYVKRAADQASMANFTKRHATGKTKTDAENIERKRKIGLNMALKREDYAEAPEGETQAHPDQKTVDAKSRKQGASKPEKPKKMALTKEEWALYDSLSGINKEVFENMNRAQIDRLMEAYRSKRNR